MSSLLYPVSVMRSLSVEKFERVLSDAFDDGSTSTRNPWTAQYFKRRFRIDHDWLTAQEFKYLRAFYAARSGRYDSFYFRDNVHRDGNALVRFAGPLQENFNAGAYRPVVALEEVAAIRALPEWNEVETAAGVAPSLWWDGSRERYQMHAGTALTESSTFDAALAETYRATWTGGALSGSGMSSQYTEYNLSSTRYAITPINLAALAAGQPAATLFCIQASAASSQKQILFATGTQSTGAALGLALAADNYLEPWLGGSETFTNARVLNLDNAAWCSLALVWTGASNNVTLYKNAASIGTDTVARSLTAGPVVMGAALDGTLKAQSFNRLNHLLIFPAALTLAQVKAVHNLLGYQHSLATVA